jgi:MFS family permease
VTAFFLAMVFFTFGYDGSVLSGILAMTPFVNQYGSVHTSQGTSLSSTDIGIMTGLPAAGCLLGLPLAAYGGDRFGWKKTLILGCVLSAVGAALQTSAYSEAQFVTGRFLSCRFAHFLFLPSS